MYMGTEGVAYTTDRVSNSIEERPDNSGFQFHCYWCLLPRQEDLHRKNNYKSLVRTIPETLERTTSIELTREAL